MVHCPDLFRLFDNVDFNVIRGEVDQMLDIVVVGVRCRSQPRTSPSHPLLLKDKLFIVQRLNGLVEAAEAAVCPVSSLTRMARIWNLLHLKSDSQEKK